MANDSTVEEKLKKKTKRKQWKSNSLTPNVLRSDGFLYIEKIQLCIAVKGYYNCGVVGGSSTFGIHAFFLLPLEEK